VPTAPPNNDITVLPNPADKFIAITANDPSALAHSTIAITDVTGHMIHRSNISSARVDLSMQPPGIYFYQIRNGEGILKSGRFAVTH
jgi:hypothetical protein